MKVKPIKKPATIKKPKRIDVGSSENDMSAPPVRIKKRKQ